MCLKRIGTYLRPHLRRKQRCLWVSLVVSTSLPGIGSTGATGLAAPTGHLATDKYSFFCSSFRKRNRECAPYGSNFHQYHNNSSFNHSGILPISHPGPPFKILTFLSLGSTRIICTGWLSSHRTEHNRNRQSFCLNSRRYLVSVTLVRRMVIFWRWH